MKIGSGDTAAINGVAFERSGLPVDWTTTGYTPKIEIQTAAGVPVLSLTAITGHPTQTPTLDGTNNWISLNGHGLSVNDQVVFATSGSLSGTGLTIAIRYYVVETDGNWFRVSLRSSGLPITITGAGTGSHTFYVVGSFQATNAQASLSSLVAGTRYKFRVKAFNGSTQVETIPPDDEWEPLEVTA